ncbi:MAG: ribonuclease HII [Chlamydiae bacterium]|nr:ribonuclease HII [Chlamydiota bacterium]
MFEPFEQKAKERGFQRIAGVDEAGRGPLAGPVVAASVIFKKMTAIRNPLFFDINDSKKLTSSKREAIYTYLTSSPDEAEYTVSVVDVDEIDTYNILQASLLAMKNAVTAHNPLPDLVFVDGNQLFNDPIKQHAVVGGDAKVLSIAAASIIAKVTRDNMMQHYHEQYPQYGFDVHKGYGTKKHIEAIQRFGLTPIHRKSFKVKTLCQEV